MISAVGVPIRCDMCPLAAMLPPAPSARRIQALLACLLCCFPVAAVTVLMSRDVMLCRERFGDPKNSKDYNCFRYPSDDLASIGPPEVLARAVVPSLAPSPRGA
jgi:hypothetical protein